MVYSRCKKTFIGQKSNYTQNIKRNTHLGIFPHYTIFFYSIVLCVVIKLFFHLQILSLGIPLNYNQQKCVVYFILGSVVTIEIILNIVLIIVVDTSTGFIEWVLSNGPYIVIEISSSCILRLYLLFLFTLLYRYKLLNEFIRYVDEK